MISSLASPRLRPFWRYYGGKWRAAPRYPAPRYRTIVEPFAGSAGYALRYHDRDVLLVDCDPVIAEIWSYLIHAPSAEIRRIPCVEDVGDLPSWVPQGARYLVGFAMNAATTHPCKTLSSGRKQLAAMGRVYEGWTEAQRASVANAVGHIRHWRVKCIDYDSAEYPAEATWFIDPPYNNRAGEHYRHGSKGIDYAALGAWCRERVGQVIVCENEGAGWLPFKPFATFKPGVNGDGSREVVWLAGDHGPQQLPLLQVPA